MPTIKFLFPTPDDVWPNREELVAEAATYAANIIKLQIASKHPVDRGIVNIRVPMKEGYSSAILQEAVRGLAEDLRAAAWRLTIRVPSQAYPDFIDINLIPIVKVTE